MSQKFLDGSGHSQWKPGFGDRFSRVALHDCPGSDGSRNHTTGADNRAFSNGQIGQNDYTGADEDIFFDMHAIGAMKMRHDCCPNTNNGSVPYRNKMRVRCLENAVVADPDLVADVNAALPVAPNPK